MLKNLSKTWGILAPDEVKYVNDTLYLLDSIEEGIPCIGQGLLPHEQDALQGYLQRCIEARGWKWNCGFCDNSDRPYFGQIVIDYVDQEVFCKASLNASLLTAYLTALAAQRPIKAGRWQHFKGDVVDALGVFPFGTRDCDDNDFTVEGEFAFEDDLTLSFQLLCWGDGYMELQHTALNLGFLPDRVAYLHDGKGFLRLPTNFLELADKKHPEHEGLLRFVEVPE